MRTISKLEITAERNEETSGAEWVVRVGKLGLGTVSVSGNGMFAAYDCDCKKIITVDTLTEAAVYLVLEDLQNLNFEIVDEDEEGESKP